MEFKKGVAYVLRNKNTGMLFTGKLVKRLYGLSDALTGQNAHRKQGQIPVNVLEEKGWVPIWASDNSVDQEEAAMKLLDGRYKHFCPDWDDLAIDEHSPEFECCTCDKERILGVNKNAQ